jgi:amidase
LDLRLYKDYVPTEDDIVVERMRRAGAITIGKTNTPEFGAGSQTFNTGLRRDAQSL